jgi:hypothetical protein
VLPAAPVKPAVVTVPTVSAVASTYFTVPVVLPAIVVASLVGLVSV